MPATEPTQPWSWQAATWISPPSSRRTASSSSAARPSYTAAPTMARRWPPVYASHGRGAPDVRIVVGVMPGTTSRAGRTSTSTGSAVHMRWAASALASRRRASAGARAPVAGGSGMRVLMGGPFAVGRWPSGLGGSPQVQVVLALPLGDHRVVGVPLGALELQIRGVELGAQRGAGELVPLERVERLAEVAGQPVDALAREVLVPDRVGVDVHRVARIELLAHP